jgi:glycosyltransferase involved in cell wall biosynthesis
VSVSHAVADHLAATHNIASIVVPNGVAVPGPAGESRIRGLGLTPGSFVLFVGRLSEEKGCHDLIEAFQQEARPGLELVFAGGATYADGYEQRIRGVAGPQVRFLGWVDPPTLAELYAHCALFVLPSSIEGLSVALLEAMSHSAACLVSDIAPNLEAIGSAGWSFRAGDAAHLSARLSALLGERDLRRQLGAAARARVEQHFGWDAVALGLARVYAGLMGTKVGESSR